jgi:hypothetical protein
MNLNKKEQERRFEEMLEQLYDLDRGQLRQLAFEALLISDGPMHIGDEDPEAIKRSTFDVVMHRKSQFAFEDTQTEIKVKHSFVIGQK